MVSIPTHRKVTSVTIQYCRFCSVLVTSTDTNSSIENVIRKMEMTLSDPTTPPEDHVPSDASADANSSDENVNSDGQEQSENRNTPSEGNESFHGSQPLSEVVSNGQPGSPPQQPADTSHQDDEVVVMSSGKWSNAL